METWIKIVATALFVGMTGMVLGPIACAATGNSDTGLVLFATGGITTLISMLVLAFYFIWGEPFGRG